MGNGEQGERARIQCVGVGGAGSNSVHRLSEQRIEGIECIAVNTDCMHLAFVDADAKLLIGRGITKGFGARGCVDTGRECALEAEGVLSEYIGRDAGLVLLSVGLGGGTGTGAAPEIARIAKRNGAQVLAIATMPFSVESTRRQRAKDGLAALGREADAIMVMDNDHLLDVAGDLPVDAAFNLVDAAIASVVRTIATSALHRGGTVTLDIGTVRSMLSLDGRPEAAVEEQHHSRPVPATAAQAAINAAMVASLWECGRSPAAVPASAACMQRVEVVPITSVLVGVPTIVESPPGAADRLEQLGPPGADTTAREHVGMAPGGPGAF
jgi:cell division protein FtsZ